MCTSHYIATELYTSQDNPIVYITDYICVHTHVQNYRENWKNVIRHFRKFLFWTQTCTNRDVHVYTVPKPLYSVLTRVQCCTRIMIVAYGCIKVRKPVYCTSPNLHLSIHVLRITKNHFKIMSYDIFFKICWNNMHRNVEIHVLTLREQLYSVSIRVQCCACITILVYGCIQVKTNVCCT